MNRRFVVTLALLVAAPVQAGSWPTPAGGTSASGDPEVLFTFDDGPNPRTTGHVLDTLAAHDIHALFFLTADHFVREDATKPRALIARMLAEGHIVGNHTVNHEQLCAGKLERAAWEIDRAHAVLEAEAGMPIPWFRTPYGAWCPRVVKLLDERGLVNWYWDIDTQEWKTGNAKLTIKRMTWALSRLQGRAVVLMHDTKLATVKALPKILEWLDAENAKRVAAGKRPIRIVQSWDYAREQLGEDVVTEAKALVTDARDVLAGGLASALP